MCIKAYFKVWSSSIQVKVEASQGTHHRHDPSHCDHEYDFSTFSERLVQKILLVCFKELVIFKSHKFKSI